MDILRLLLQTAAGDEDFVENAVEGPTLSATVKASAENLMSAGDAAWWTAWLPRFVKRLVIDVGVRLAMVVNINLLVRQLTTTVVDVGGRITSSF